MNPTISFTTILKKILVMALLGFLVVTLAWPLITLLALAAIGYLAWSLLSALGAGRLTSDSMKRRAAEVGIFARDLLPRFAAMLVQIVVLAIQVVAALVAIVPLLLARTVGFIYSAFARGWTWARGGAARSREVLAEAPVVGRKVYAGAVDLGQRARTTVEDSVWATKLGIIGLETASGAAIGGVLGGVAAFWSSRSEGFFHPETLMVSCLLGGVCLGFLVGISSARRKSLASE